MGILDSTFEMNGGTISGNYADLGGGICAFGTCTVNSVMAGPASLINANPNKDGFRVTGGLITDNSAIDGGGIYAFYLLGLANSDDVDTVISGAKVTKNKATNGLGGGLYLEDCSNIVLNSTTVIFDNTSSDAADDIYKSNGSPMASLPTASDISTNANDDFSGWYHDNPDNRYSPDNAVEYTPVASESNVVYLKIVRSDKNRWDISFDGNSNDATDVPEDETVVEGNKVTEPPAPVRAGYKFTGWYTDAECTQEYDFDEPVEGPVTLYAGWEKEAENPDNPPADPDNPGTPDNPSDPDNPNVTDNPDKPDSDDSSDTEDNSMLSLFGLLLAVSAAAGTTVLVRRSRREN